MAQNRFFAIGQVYNATGEGADEFF